MFITARNSSCGKVIFSQASVSHSVHGGGCACLVPGQFVEWEGVCGGIYSPPDMEPGEGEYPPPRHWT